MIMVATTTWNASITETALAEHPRSGFLALAGMDFVGIMTE
jgi:hypothetical protein